MNPKDAFRGSELWRSMRILTRRDQIRLFLVALFQISFSFLDLAGVAAIGMIGALTIRGVGSQGPGDRVAYVLEILHLENQTLQNQVAVLAVAATSLFLLRTLLSIVLGLLFAGVDLGAGLLVFSVKNSFSVSIMPPSGYSLIKDSSE